MAQGVQFTAVRHASVARADAGIREPNSGAKLSGTTVSSRHCMIVISFFVFFFVLF